MERLTDKAWRNLDPWECCGQDNYCKRGCHEDGGCTKGCIVPKNYRRLAKYEDTELTPDEIKQNMSWNSRHEELFLEIKARDKIIGGLEDKIAVGELVEVVRCKDCKRNVDGQCTLYIGLPYRYICTTGYCENGEKRSDNNGD